MCGWYTPQSQLDKVKICKQSVQIVFFVKMLIKIYQYQWARVLNKISFAQSSQLLGISCANQPKTALLCMLIGKSNLSE